MIYLRLLTSLAIVPLISGLASAEEITDQEREFFEKRIRPVLVEHCYGCHSAKSDELKGGLRLDFADGLRIGGDSGPAVVIGKPSESILISSLKYEGMEMPPSGRLPDQVIRDFEHWVAAGAADPRLDAPHANTASREIDIERGRRFWSFLPVTDPGAPSGSDSASSSVDAFINDSIVSAGIEPEKRADPASLLRRVYFDLTGLPPDPDRLEAFLDNPTSSALTAEVDRLLSSDQFGVHWGRHWLDVARYADSNGNDFNATFHDAWRYRDYVIAAFNDDKPFDQFIREQIAGDLLPCDSDHQRKENLVATGFLMLGSKMLSERDKDKLRMDVVDEQVSTVGSAFLGMTLGCARCHDHKFDPIPTEDYYALAGIFKSTRTLEGESQKYVSTWPATPLPADPKHMKAVEKYQAEESSLEKQLSALKKTIGNLEKQIGKSKSLSSGYVIDDVAAELTGYWKKSSLTPPFVGAGYIHDDLQDKGRKSVCFRWTPPRSANYEVRISYVHGSNRASNVPITIEHADGQVQAFLDETKPPTLDGMFTPLGRFPFKAGQSAVVTINTEGTKGYVIVDALQLVEVDASGAYVQRSTSAEPSDFDTSIQQELADSRAKEKALTAQIEALRNSAPAPLPQAFAVADHQEIGDCPVCVRGEHRNTGAIVPRGFLQVASWNSTAEFTDAQSGRVQLANWIADPQNPLTGRVIVNRIWSHLFGEGLVRSVDNFGTNGERPTHPLLLDHLAARLVTPSDRTTPAGAAGFGWSLKALIRELVLTDVYQRSTQFNEAAAAVDPENRLLWRANRKRLPAEAIRDAMLMASGRLSLSPGGSPVEGFGVLVKTNNADANEVKRKESSYRSAYLPIIRSELPPMLTAFDFADSDMVVGKRPVTNVPAQALMLMNSPFVMDNAAGTAEQLISDGTLTVGQLIDLAYRKVLNRKATPEEIQQGTEFLDISDSTRSIATAFAGSRHKTVPVTDEGNLIVSEGDDRDAGAKFRRFIHVLFASTEFRLLN
ncbi:MAG: DUF1553 domain-containing protein [Planctomycetaceae bacterium]|nr:DUF1553 domain-containing protein [Planctomycetaceae bacterium]